RASRRTPFLLIQPNVEFTRSYGLAAVSGRMLLFKRHCPRAPEFSLKCNAYQGRACRFPCSR
ncbi:MAG: hypothetical protein ABSE43_16095, partial [Steroidobacteraceae bacterium]